MNASLLEKRALQAAVSLAAALPVSVGAWDVLHVLASHERYLSGLLLAIGLGFWSAVPDIGAKSGRFRLLTSIVAVGGLCRLLGVAMGDPLSTGVVVALIMELAVTPALCLWQSRLSRPANRRASAAHFLPQFES